MTNDVGGGNCITVAWHEIRTKAGQYTSAQVDNPAHRVAWSVLRDSINRDIVDAVHVPLCYRLYGLNFYSYTWWPQ